MLALVRGGEVNDNEDVTMFVMITTMMIIMMPRCASCSDVDDKLALGGVVRLMTMRTTMFMITIIMMMMINMLT